MKKNNLMTALMLSAGLLLGACGSNEPKQSEEKAPEIAEQVINTTHAYICPMNCENSASNEPGQCKVCGMDLVKNPNYAGAASDTTMSTDTSTTGMDMKEGVKEESHEGHNH